MHYFVTLRRLRNATLTAIMVALALGLPSEAGADIGVTVAADSDTDPDGSYYVIAAAPGQVIVQQLQIRNEAEQATAIEIAAVDATTGENGGVIYGLATDSVSKAGAWITLPVRQATLAPGETALFQLRVSVPDDALPGVHVAGLAVIERGKATSSALETNSAGVGAAIAVINRQVIAVQVEVAGARNPSMEIESAGLLVRPTGVVIEIILNNNGTELLHPTGSLQVSSDGEQPELTHEFTLGTVLPGTRAPIIIPWQSDSPLPGTYAVHVVATDETGARATWTDSLTVDAAVEESVEERVLREPAVVTERIAVSQPLPITQIFGGAAGLIILWFALSELRTRRAARRDSRRR